MMLLAIFILCRYLQYAFSWPILHKRRVTLYAKTMSTNVDTVMQAHRELVDVVLAAAPSAKLFSHKVCKTSEESMEARYEASGERVVGAKALLIKIGIGSQPDTFAVVVLPGPSRLDSKLVKKELKARIAGMRSFRFATPEEMYQKARGMQPGKMPPMGRPLFPDIAFTFIDKALTGYDRIGFNAADFESSIIIDSKEYLAIVQHDGIVVCSEN